MFYKVNTSGLEEIAKKKIQERDVQKLVEANLKLLFGLEFIESELSIENVRFDTLAFDEDAKAPVIIEFKNTFEKSLFDQGLEYLHILLSRKADFTIRLHKKLGISADPDGISWQDARVFFIGNHFSERQKRAISFRDLPVELWTFDWLQNDFFRLERENLRKEAALEFAKAGRGSPVIDKVRREIKEYDRQYHEKDSTPKIWELFQNFENLTKDVGDFEVLYRKDYIAFWSNGSSFCQVHILKSRLQVHFGKKKDIEILVASEGVKDISSKEWNHALMYEVSSQHDLNGLVSILKKAHELS